MFGRNAFDAEEHAGDFALTGVMLAGVGGAQHGLEPATLLGGHSLIGWNLIAVKISEQTVEGGDAIKAVPAQMNQRCKGCVGTAACRDNKMKTELFILQDYVQGFGRGPDVTVEKHTQPNRLLSWRRNSGHKAKDAGIGAFAPEYRLFTCRKLWSRREIANPNEPPYLKE